MNAKQTKVLLIGWDAADWKVIKRLMEAGQMPHLQRFVEQGTMGQIATLHPPLSPMLWTSIATGKRPFKHGIHGFSEPTQDGLSVQPVTNLSRKCKAIWNILNQHGLTSTVIGWWPSHPAEPLNGVTVSDHYHRARGPIEQGWPLMPHCVHPPELAETLAELRLHPSEIVGEMLEFLVPRAREVDQDQDRRLAGAARTLCECVSIHSAATWLIENRPWDFFAVYYDAIDHFCHGFMKYHPPRQEWISERDFELYQHVVAGAYRLHDQMLGTLLSKIGDDVTVILMSDHGFHPDHLRPQRIPDIPAGPAVEHRDFGILALRGAGIKRDELLHGACVLDITPTVLTLYGLPVGADMDGKVLVGAFEQVPDVQTIPTWEDVAGDDGRHPPHTRLDPVAAKESLEQLVALGYIAKPNEDRQIAVADTIAELQYNLGEAYQDADRHLEAVEIFRGLHRADPDEQRLAVHRFVSCQALGLLAEMQEIVDDLDGRRRELFTKAQPRLKEFAELIRQRREERSGASPSQSQFVHDAELLDEAVVSEDFPAKPDNQAGQAAPKPEPLLSPDERQELVQCRKWARFAPLVVDYLKAQLLSLRGQHGEALEALGRVLSGHVDRPGLFLQTARLYLKLGRWDEAEQAYREALSLDPDNAHAHLGMCRVALHKHDPAGAAQSALFALERIYNFPMAHFLLGVSLTGLKDFARAADAFRAALAINPNFAQAHLRLARLLARRLNDKTAARSHFRIYRQMRARAGQATLGSRLAQLAADADGAPIFPAVVFSNSDSSTWEPLADSTIIVSGLPRSGTSMVMQMVAAGGLPVLTDGLRAADDDNPRGYYEHESVKNLPQNNKWVADTKGKAVKIVAPLLRHLPADVPYRVILMERNLDEVLASQSKMLSRRGEAVDETPARRNRLKDEYGRLMQRVKAQFGRHPTTHVLVLRHDDVLRDPQAAADSLNDFLGGGLSTAAMVAEVKPTLHRHRAGVD